MPPFDAHQYWNTRLREQFSLEGVGWLGMSEPFNRWMYKVRRDVFVREVTRHIGDMSTMRVLDVGSGTGMYVELWKRVGAAEVVASDFSEVAVDNLHSRFPADQVVQLDITDQDRPTVLYDRRFDVVSAMDMLFHIVDDDAYERAIDNLVELLNPGGFLVFTENFLRGATQRGEHQVSRSANVTESLLTRSGATPVTRQPTFVLMNTPVDSDSRALHFWWRHLGATVRRGPRLAKLLGGAVYGVESCVLRVGHYRGPSTKLAIWRKKRTSTQASFASSSETVLEGPPGRSPGELWR
jgi:SAM-dependent methyltransferase